MPTGANPHPSSQDIKVAADAAIFTVQDGELKVLVIQMKKSPYAGRWALPGGLIDDKETTEQTVRRVLKDEAGVTDVYLEQLGAFDAPGRDPFGRVVSVAYFALIPLGSVALKTSPKYADVRWASLAELKGLAYDHDDVLAAAVARVQERLGYSNVAWSLLPKAFTLAQLQEVYEAILGEAMDKRNFRKKIMASGLVTGTGKQLAGGAHRPAELFKFKTRRVGLTKS